MYLCIVRNLPSTHHALFPSVFAPDLTNQHTFGGHHKASFQQCNREPEVESIADHGRFRRAIERDGRISWHKLMKSSTSLASFCF